MKKTNKISPVQEFIDQMPLEKQEMLPMSMWILKEADTRQSAFKTATSVFYRNDFLFCNGFYKPISRFTKYTS